jgi:XRE family transcriptional regulator, aerobic/anaerobic benzoate catabolism transcriptional regulator
MLQPESRMRALGDRVRSARKEKAWSRRELAQHTGISERFLADVELGKANPSLMRLFEIADTLGLTPGELLRDPRPAGVYPGVDRDRVLALVGLRGAGKSSLGPMLATRLGRDFVELDEEIEKRTGLELSEIFELHGEAWFRRQELECLDQLLEEGRPLVLAVGGGLPTSPESWTLLRSKTRTIWLRARPEDHWLRVTAQGDTRPMSNDPRAFDHLSAILNERERFYSQAEFEVDTSQLKVSEAFGRILGLLERGR